MFAALISPVHLYAKKINSTRRILILIYSLIQQQRSLIPRLFSHWCMQSIRTHINHCIHSILIHLLGRTTATPTTTNNLKNINNNRLLLLPHKRRRMTDSQISLSTSTNTLNTTTTTLLNINDDENDVLIKDDILLETTVIAAAVSVPAITHAIDKTHLEDILASTSTSSDTDEEVTDRNNLSMSFFNQMLSFTQNSQINEKSTSASLSKALVDSARLKINSRQHIPSDSNYITDPPKFTFEWIVGLSCVSKKLIMNGTTSPPTLTSPMHLIHERQQCGEDAHFSSNTPTHATIGVADGVGGWVTFGVDPAVFAWELMTHCMQCAETSIAVPRPWDVMRDAFDMVKSGGMVDAGSSTACIALLDKETGELTSANLGDSGYVVFRLQPDSDNTHRFVNVLEASKGQHFFNAPYQLSIVPNSIPQEQRKFFLEDQPADAHRKSYGPLRHGDIIVMATDGLFDNVFVSEMGDLLAQELSELLPFLAHHPSHAYFPQSQERTTSINSIQYGDSRVPMTDIDNEADISEALQSQDTYSSQRTHLKLHPENLHAEIRSRVQKAASSLVREACILSRSKRISPFEKESRSVGGLSHDGGKVDDVTVVTAVVVVTEHVENMALL